LPKAGDHNEPQGQRNFEYSVDEQPVVLCAEQARSIIVRVERFSAEIETDYFAATATAG
jgi:hypothetical protein